MRFLVTDRQKGKTTKIIREALRVGKDAPTCLLTFNDVAARAIRKAFNKQLIGSKLEVFSLQQFQLIGDARKYKHVYIDDVDQILYALVHGSLADDGMIRLATATGLPIHDMGVLREAGVALWQDAHDILLREFMDENERPMGVTHVLGIMKERMARLAAENAKHQGGANENRNGSDQGADPGSVQQLDPPSDGGPV